ncbi:hypothetical protein HYH03_009660 [Edaphochlamys debaryana]|uniref:ODAD1 central coiled coil region domain-containing protein n=1 Tax=Edaphochlamys debaryana TaxID=47281 RepID=A0A835XXW9_9CHLO|nr:hypothetical protein HYH03_009660 [Edaphochlamys debaryana]|eukprot:KAG2491925.1 hypothetical protein HYH03_009660 [Edaphochlamys debaryana]
MASNGSATVHELQARIRELEATRKSRAEEAQRIIASQRTTIDRLRAENHRLGSDLANVGNTDAAAYAQMVTGAVPRPAGLTPAQTERSDKLMEVADTYQRKIDVEQRQLESLEREVELAQAQLLAAQRDVGGHSGSRNIQVAPAKAVKALETRLEQAQKRFNEHIAANRDLKQQIDAATRRQAGMEQVRAQLEREVAAVAAELQAVHEASRVAQDAKQEAFTQLQALRVAEDAEVAAFEAEMRELAVCQNTDEQLLEAQAARLMKVVAAADAAEEGGAGGGEPLDLDTLEQGAGVEAAAQQLQRAAGLSSLPETLRHYAALEQASFDAFTACNEASERIAGLQREARELQAEIRSLETEAVAGRQSEAIRVVLCKRDAAHRRAEGILERRLAVERRVTMLRTGVLSCLRKLGASAAADSWEASAPSPLAPSVLDDPDAPLPCLAACAHVMAGLALLEQRAAAIVAVQGTLVGRSATKSRPASSGRPPSAALPSTLGPSASSASAGGGPARSLSMASASSKGGPGLPVGRSASVASNGSGAGLRGGAGGRPEMIEESDDEDEMPLTREQIQARSASRSSRG